MPAKTPAREPREVTGKRIGKRVELARRDRVWKQSELVDELHKLGFTSWWQSRVAKIENGDVKRVTVDDLLSLSLALGVEPALLLAPDDGDVQVAPALRCSAEDFRAWLRGQKPLRPEDEWTYRAGKLVPEPERRNVLVRGVRAEATATAHPGEVDDGD